MSSIQLFSKFCQFIDERIFSEDNIGSSVAFVVDKALINEFFAERIILLSVT